MYNSKIRKYIKHQILNKNNHCYGYEEEFQNLYNVIKRTIVYGESNSSLLIGSPGSGKSVLINAVLNKFKTELTELYENATVIRLNGLIHTDDKLTLRSITAQLYLESTLQEHDIFGSFADNLNFLMNCLKTGSNKQTKSIIFILDEFQLFCTHHNQTLLYNLFDVAQSAQTPIFVLGITCNVSVIELLEKRIRSRFSQRKIWLFSNCIGREKQILSLEEGTDLPKKEIQCWNEHIQSILKESCVQKTIKMVASMIDNESYYRNLLFQFISRLQENQPWPQANDLCKILQSCYYLDSNTHLLFGLSVLEISLIIAMKHQYEIYDSQPFNFEMIFDRYKKFVNGTPGLQAESHTVAQKAFEHIKEIEFIVPIGGKLQPEYQMYNLSLIPQQISDIIKMYPGGLPTSISQWALSSLQ